MGPVLTVVKPDIGPHRPRCSGYGEHVARAAASTPDGTFSPRAFNEVVLRAYDAERLIADPDAATIFDTFEPWGEAAA